MNPKQLIHTLVTGKNGPLMIVLAGPNGAGKSTFVREYFAAMALPFLNADNIARQLQPDSPAAAAVSAAKSVVALREQFICGRRSFITETVFASQSHLKSLLAVCDAGYDVIIICIGTTSVTCNARVITRVRAGGHDIPDKTQAARYQRVLKNFKLASRSAPLVIFFDNSTIAAPFKYIAAFENGRQIYLAKALPSWFIESMRDD